MPFSVAERARPALDLLEPVADELRRQGAEVLMLKPSRAPSCVMVVFHGIMPSVDHARRWSALIARLAEGQPFYLHRNEVHEVEGSVGLAVTAVVPNARKAA